MHAHVLYGHQQWSTCDNHDDIIKKSKICILKKKKIKVVIKTIGYDEREFNFILKILLHIDLTHLKF